MGVGVEETSAFIPQNQEYLKEYIQPTLPTALSSWVKVENT